MLFRRSYSTWFKTNDKEHVVRPLPCTATQPFFVSSRNAPPHWRGGALCYNTKNACGADYYVEVTSKTRAGGSLSKGWQHTVTLLTRPPIKTFHVMQYDQETKNVLSGYNNFFSATKRSIFKYAYN